MKYTTPIFEMPLSEKPIFLIFDYLKLFEAEKQSSTWRLAMTRNWFYYFTGLVQRRKRRFLDYVFRLSEMP